MQFFLLRLLKSTMRFNAVLWAFLALQPVYAAKMMAFRSPTGTLVVKLKAENFVNQSTIFGELGGIKLLDHKGACINCEDAGAVCSAPNTPNYKVADAQLACNTKPEAGDKWSWRVNKSSPWDIKLEYPLKSLHHEMNFQIEVISAVDQSGKNSPVQMGRQVTSWVAVAMLGTSTHRAWLKSALNVNGHFSKVVKGDLMMEIPKTAEDIFDEVCTSPAATNGYDVTENNLVRHRFHVSAKCAKDYVGTAQVTECDEDKDPYTLSGCRLAKCTSPETQAGYEVSARDLSIASFDVEVSCMSGYAGTAVVTKCGGDNLPFSVTGCEPTTTTTSTTTTTTTTTSTTTTTVTTTTTTTETTTTSTSTTTTTSTTSTTTSTTTTTTFTTTTTSTTTTTTSTTSTTTVTSTTTTATSTTTTTSTSTITSTTTITTTTTTCTTTSTTTSTTTVVLFCVEAEDKTGYDVTVASLELNEAVFSVKVSCADGYYGTAKVTMCESAGAQYKISGCNKIQTCEKPQALGYTLSNGSLNLHDWSITGICAAYFHGTAKITPCTKDGEEFQISGCEADTCSSPADTTGYAITEDATEAFRFSVETACAPGYVGEPKATACKAHTGEYELSGCVQTTTTTSTTTVTTTTTTTSTTTSTTTTSTTTTTTTTSTTTSTI